MNIDDALHHADGLRNRPIGYVSAMLADEVRRLRTQLNAAANYIKYLERFADGYYGVEESEEAKAYYNAGGESVETMENSTETGRNR